MSSSDLLDILLDLLHLGSADGADAFVVSALHLTGATLVTIHVLLRKRDVGAAISWIGLAWLSPLIGSALYLALGINRVARRARRLRRAAAHRRPPLHEAGPAPDDDLMGPLRIAGDAITGRAMTGGNRIHVLMNGDGAYPPMLAAIDEALRSLAMSTYIIRDDKIGGQFVAALIRAHQRGVRTRVLIDGVGGGYFRSPAYHALREAGVAVARFHHVGLPWRMPFLNMRNHKKVLILDGRLAFTGGLNIGDENLVASNPKSGIRDTHFRVEGPVVAQLTEAFADDWQMVTGDPLEGADWFPALGPAGPAQGRVVTAGPDEDVNQLELLLLAAIAVARRSIRIATPYFVPPERLVSALGVASLRGVSVDIVLPRRADHRLMDWAARAHVRPMLNPGCRLWYAPGPFDHSKLLTIDGTWSLIGSANWDTRSLRLNFELDLEIKDPDFAQRIEKLIAGMGATPVTRADLDGAPLAARVRNAAARLLLPYL